MKPEMTLSRLWWYHRQNNSKSVVDEYVIDALWDRHDIDYIEIHAVSIQWMLARLERAWQRVHKYDHAWAAKLSRETGKPVCVWLNQNAMEAV